MADPHFDTATQRPATGLDEGARLLILLVLQESTGGDANAAIVAAGFFRDRYGGPNDYLGAVETVWGHAERFLLERAISEAQAEAQFPTDFRRRVKPEIASARAMLLHMPEPDFRVAVEAVFDAARWDSGIAERISSICRNRGVPWTFSVTGKFEYVGDEVVERDLIRPAAAAINRAEFSGGVRAEFEAARRELAEGKPASLKQAVHEAGCAVESAMKVVLERHGVAFDGQRDTANKLFDLLESAGLVPRHMQNFVLSPMTPRNRRGGHGAGAIAHAVDLAEAEAMVAGAAGSIAYLAKRLP